MLIETMPKANRFPVWVYGLFDSECGGMSRKHDEQQDEQCKEGDIREMEGCIALRLVQIGNYYGAVQVCEDAVKMMQSPGRGKSS